MANHFCIFKFQSPRPRLPEVSGLGDITKMGPNFLNHLRYTSHSPPALYFPTPSNKPLTILTTASNSDQTFLSLTIPSLPTSPLTPLSPDIKRKRDDMLNGTFLENKICQTKERCNICFRIGTLCFKIRV